MSKLTKRLLITVAISLAVMILFRNVWFDDITGVAITDGFSEEQIADGLHADGIIKTRNWLGLIPMLAYATLLLATLVLVVNSFVVLYKAALKRISSDGR